MTKNVIGLPCLTKPSPSGAWSRCFDRAAGLQNRITGFRLTRDSEARGRSMAAPPLLMDDPATIIVSEGSAHKGIGFRLVFTIVRG